MPKETKQVKYALWTGGWDSTFMVIRLLRQGNIVQPIYIVDSSRASIQFERKAMAKLRKSMAKYNYWKGELLPTEIVKIEEIPENSKISETWKKVNADTQLGIQHEWLARYAAWKNRDLYLGHEKGISENGHMTRTLNKYVSLIKNEDGVFVVDKNRSTQEGIVLLGHMLFPIMDCLETDMLKIINSWHLQDVMKDIWFCHTPTKNGKPCGKCHPCRIKYDSGMGFLLPRKELWHFRIKKIRQRISSLFN